MLMANVDHRAKASKNQFILRENDRCVLII